MAGGLSSLIVLVLSSCMLVGGKNCSLTSVTQFHFSTVTVSAESEKGTTPGVRVIWSTTVSPECVISVRVEFRTSNHGPVVASNTTTNMSQTEIIQTGLECSINYYIRVVVTGEVRPPRGMLATPTLSPQQSDLQVDFGDIPVPFGVKAKVTADNTSIKVSWEWSCQGVLDLVRVDYQSEGGSLMMYTMDNTTSTSATLPSLHCNTKYTVWVYVRGGQINRTSAPIMVSLPARAPTTPTGVTAEVITASSVRVVWQWTSSGPAPNCLNTTTVTYRPEGGGESSLQLSDPAATEATLTDLQCNTSYTITVVATAGEHRSKSVARTVFLPQQGTVSMCPQVSDNHGISTSPGESIDPGQTDNSSGNIVMVAGVAVSVVLLVLAAVSIVVLVVWLRQRQGHGKDATVELDDMADSHSNDSKEDQDADTFFDNGIYEKIPSKKQKGKNASVELVGRDSAENKEDQDMAISVDNICYDKLTTSPPTIVDYQWEVQCLEGEQVSLMVKTTGSPTPTVSWFFNGRKVEDDYSTELGKDGSLVLVSAELKHAGTYTFTVSNRVGSVEGCTKLVVHTEDEESASVPRVESNPVTREKFGEYVSSFHAHNNSAFIGQFQTLSSGEEGHQLTIGKSAENRLLNRFKNIAPYDGHRVVLKPFSDGVDCGHDYINATYIDGYSQGKKYIATQGPLPNTVTDFWRLVWQEQVHVVAMVTNTVERGQHKCEQYWPDEGTKEYGLFKVTLTDQQVFADYTIRQLFVSCDKVGGSLLKVTQFHFTSWPDHGVPEYAGPILNYLCRMKAQMKLSRGPTLVHCSAGIGRTGTLIAIDTALEQAAKENVVDISAIVTKMRRQRMKMVQNSCNPPRTSMCSSMMLSWSLSPVETLRSQPQNSPVPLRN